TGALKKTANLEPFDVGGRDTVYGGLGNDSLHGGADNDALSGAEALDGFYRVPASTPAVVFDPATGDFVGFSDAKKVTSLNKILGHPLNFEAFTGTAATKIDDGAD